ncbi:MAG: hypothetical protein WB586_08160 [Chthoniobacterales bacterium]
MPNFTRVEFSRSLRPNTPRFVLMIEIPDDVASELKARKVSYEARAYEVAFETAHADQSNKPAHHMTLMSCTRGKIKHLESLGEPNLIAPDGCRGWVIRRPREDFLDQGWRARERNPGFQV